MPNRKYKFFTGKTSEQYSPAAIFTQPEIHQILDLYHYQGKNYNQIANHFNVTLVTIKYIVEGKSYSKWVKEWEAAHD